MCMSRLPRAHSGDLAAQATLTADFYRQGFATLDLHLVPFSATRHMV